METIADLLVRLGLDPSQFTAGLSNAKKEVDDLSKQLSTDFKKAGKTTAIVGAGMTAAITLPMALIGKESISMASDLEEQLSKVDQVFLDSAGGIHAWARNTAKDWGISRLEATEYAGTFGNILTTQGLVTDEASKLSQALVELAADQGAFNNLETADVLDKFKSALIGQYRPLLDLGIVLNADAVEAKALEMGLLDVNGEISEGAKVQARFALMMEQSGNAIGQFGRESEGLAAQQKIMQSVWADIKSEIGTALLPVVIELFSAFSEFLSDPAVIETLKEIAKTFGEIGIQVAEWIIPHIKTLLAWFQRLSDEGKGRIAVVAVILAALGPILLVLGGILTTIGTIIGAVGIAGGALIGAIVLLGTTIAVFGKSAMQTLRTWWALWDAIFKLIGIKIVELKDKLVNTLVGAFNKVTNAIKGVITWVKELIASFMSIELPDWLTPGSPTPFEIGLWGIQKALKSVAQTSLPEFQAQVNYGAIPGISGTYSLEQPEKADYPTAREIGRAVAEALMQMGINQ